MTGAADGPVAGAAPDGLATVAELIGDASRAAILLSLADGRARPAGLLARLSGIAPSTASTHLARLVEGGLLAVETHGRHRYYRLASADTVEALERLSALSGDVRRRPGRFSALAWGRTCYDHLAGKLGVALMRALLDASALTGGDGCFHAATAVRDRLSARGRDVRYELTGSGRRLLLGDLGVVLPRSRRPLVRYCVDWSEQSHHLSGLLGAGVLQRFQDLGWLRRHSGSREVTLTRQGERALPEALGMRIPDRG